MFDGKILLITGGTGSFGNAVLSRFLGSSIKEIRIFSRDEKKQDEQRRKYADSRLRYYLGDTRDANSVATVMRGVDYVFHAAALKQVPSCEFFPIEAVKTNVLGTENVLAAAISARVRKVVCLSTDKAVYPINSMGLTKALMEKVAIAMSRGLEGDQTTICTTRYGNVMASRGSVIPLFLQQIQDGIPITLTDPAMTRFMMTLDDAIDLVLFAFANGKNGEIFVQKAPAATVETISQALRMVIGLPDHPTEIIGTRHGEKLFEILLSREEVAVAQDMGRYFRVSPDSRDLNYARYVSKGLKGIENAVEYTSHNTHRLDLRETADLLKNLALIQNFMSSGSLKHQDV